VHEITITSQLAASNPQFNVVKEGTIMSGTLTYKKKNGLPAANG
jgi:hypothetical protein